MDLLNSSDLNFGNPDVIPPSMRYSPPATSAEVAARTAEADVVSSNKVVAECRHAGGTPYGFD